MDNNINQNGVLNKHYKDNVQRNYEPCVFQVMLAHKIEKQLSNPSVNASRFELGSIKEV